NGVVESWVDYTITLRPLRTGTLDIPPLTIGDARTTPLTLGVRGVPDEIRAGIDRMVFFELELSRDPVYVRAETVLTRRLYYSGDTQIYSELPGPPEIPDVQIVPVGETRSFPVVRDGLRYGVIEQQFALFPAVAGPLRIPSIALTASVRLMLDGSVRRTGAPVRSPERTVNVLPIPPSWPRNTPWLPATDVSITDTWSPDTRTYTVGEPIERTIDIRVAGNLAAAIPPPPDALPLDLLRQYPEPPALADDRTGASVTGRRLSQSSLLAVEAGAATVQPVTVTWWDVTADALRVSNGPARNLTLTGAPETRGPETGLPLAGEAATGGAETAEPESDASKAAREPEPARAPSSTAGPEADGGIWNATLALLQSVPSRVQPLVQSLTRQHAVALAFALLLAATALLGWRMRRTIGAMACTLGRTVEATLTAMGLMGTRRGP
ncbi:MAG: BatD family protein, partial [Gammaproteobacteria bacterium]